MLVESPWGDVRHRGDDESGRTSWQTRVTITTETSEVAWADDLSPSDEVFYRVVLVTNSTSMFQTFQQALHRACTNQGIVGATAAAILPRDGLWLGTYGTSDGITPIRPQTPLPGELLIALATAASNNPGGAVGSTTMNHPSASSLVIQIPFLNAEGPNHR